MKTKILLLATIISISSLCLCASEPTTLDNVIKTKTGSTKETTFFHEGSKEPSKRAISNYNQEGQLTDKTAYEWKGSRGWVALQKFEYTYADPKTSTPSSVIHTKWDVKNRCWSKNNNTTKY